MAKILVASDAPSVRREVVSATSAPDVDVVEAASGPAVVQAVLHDTPDLVVVDMQMGNMGGMSV